MKCRMLLEKYGLIYIKVAFRIMFSHHRMQVCMTNILCGIHTRPLP